jgi:4-azaleucine resistance transporter AzlC
MSEAQTEGATSDSTARSEFRRGLSASAPIMLGVVPMALVLGAQAAQKGLTVAEVPLMTGLNFAGGSEFAAVNLWSSPPHLLLIVAMTLLVNSRHLLMGAALAPFIKHLPKRKAFPALFVMCDESWALGMADARQRASAGISASFSLSYYAGVSAGVYSTWVLFTTLGAAIGPTIGNAESFGFDMAFPAVFLVLLRGMWQGTRAARPWLVSLAVAVVTSLLVPGAWYVPAGALSGILSAWIWAGEAP